MLTITNKYQNNINYHYGIDYKNSVQKAPVFRSNNAITRDIFNPMVQITKNATCFFRGDLNWKKFCKLILSTFKEGEKMDIVCVPCSDGSEPVSLLLKLMQFKKFRKNIDNFSGIKAYDIDEKQLNIAKSNKIPLLNDMFAGIMDYAALISNAFKGLNKTYTVKDGCLELHNDFKNKIKYEKKDIVEVVENLPKDEKVVLMARNIFPYLDDFSQIPRVIRALSKLKEGSILAIGDFDKKIPDIEKEIMEQGYKRTNTKNCFIKTKNK